MSNREANIRDRLESSDVTVARSYLEVDFMEWFSDNEIAFGYEAFTIPSVVGPGKDEWDTMVDAIQAIGRGEEEKYGEMVADTRFEDRTAFEVLDMWANIYDKHGLQDEDVSVPVQDSLSRFDKRLILPDFALYFDEGSGTASDEFEWSDWDAIVEVSGLWGVGLPDEATENDWWTWYRVSAVAFKEFVYRLLDLWENVWYAVPNQPQIRGVTDGIPAALRDDDHYVIFDTTQAAPDLSELYVALGLSGEDVSDLNGGLSPPVDLIEYRRPLDEGTIVPVRWSYDDVDIANVDEDENALALDAEWVVFLGELGEVYVSGDSVHVRESQWRYQNMILIREYVMDVMGQLADDGIVVGLSS